MPIVEVNAELVPPPIFSPHDEDDNDEDASRDYSLAASSAFPVNSPQPQDVELPPPRTPVAEVHNLRVALRHTTSTNSSNSGRNTSDGEELPMQQRAVVVPPQPAAPTKNKPMRMWLFGRTSSPEKVADNSPVKAQKGSSPKQQQRQRQKKKKLQRILEERAASRRIDTQPGRIRAIAGPLGGGHLRYGALRFPRTDGAPSIWACIASGAPESAISAIRSSMWRLGRPTMLISVAGTSALAPRKERALVAGLAKVVRTTNAWLLTPGMLNSAGVLVDRLVDAWEDERSPPTCIGMMRWEALDESLRTKLEGHPNGMCFDLRRQQLEGTAHEMCRKHTFLLLHKQVASDRQSSPQPLQQEEAAAAAAAAAIYPPSTPGALTPAAAAAAALAEWRDVIAFERHVCHRREKSRNESLQGGAGGGGTGGGDSSASGDGGAPSVGGDEKLQPSPCALLLCVGGDVSLLERILCHLTQGPVRLPKQRLPKHRLSASGRLEHACPAPTLHSATHSATLAHRANLPSSVRAQQPAHNPQGSPIGTAGAVVVIADSGGVCSALYHFWRSHVAPPSPSQGSTLTGAPSVTGAASIGAPSNRIEGGACAPAPDTDGVDDDHLLAPELSTQEREEARRSSLLLRITEAALLQREQGREPLTFVASTESESALCEHMLNAALDSCGDSNGAQAFDRVLHAVSWAEPALVREQLQLVPALEETSEGYQQCLAVALENALLLSLTDTRSDAVVKLLLGFHPQTERVSLGRLVDSRAREQAAAAAYAGDGITGFAVNFPVDGDDDVPSMRMARDRLSANSRDSNEGASLLDEPSCASMQHKNSLLPRSVFVRRASLGVRLSINAIQAERQEEAATPRGHTSALDPFDRLCELLRGGGARRNMAAWNSGGYAMHVKARRQLLALLAAEETTTRPRARSTTVPAPLAGSRGSQGRGSYDSMASVSCFNPLELNCSAGSERASSPAGASSPAIASTLVGDVPRRMTATTRVVKFGEPAMCSFANTAAAAPAAAAPAAAAPAAAAPAAAAPVAAAAPTAAAAPAATAPLPAPLDVSSGAAGSSGDAVAAAAAEGADEEAKGPAVALTGGAARSRTGLSLSRPGGRPPPLALAVPGDAPALPGGELAAKLRRATLARSTIVRCIDLIRRPTKVTRTAPLQPTPTDLLLWAVASNKHSLARKLWEATEEPLRAAIIISRVSRHLQQAGQGVAGGSVGAIEDLSLHADEYERWATGVLDRVPNDKQQVMDLLTRAPMRQVGSQTVHLWGNSVLDEATERAYPAMSFVAHRHCQSVLTDFWLGNFCGSPCAIARAGLLRLLGQIVIQAIFLGFPPSALCLVSPTHPDYRIFGAADEAEAETTGAEDTTRPGCGVARSGNSAHSTTEDDEFCRAYFSRSVRQVRRRSSLGARTAGQRWITQQSVVWLSRAKGKLFSTARQGDDRTPTSAVRRERSEKQREHEEELTLQFEQWVSLQLAFWRVPKVRRT